VSIYARDETKQHQITGVTGTNMPGAWHQLADTRGLGYAALGDPLGRRHWGGDDTRGRV